MSTSPPPPAPEEQGSPKLALLVGLAILGVAAFVIFGTGGATSGRADAAKSGGAADQAAAGAKSSVVEGNARVRGGVDARDVDEAQGRAEPEAKKYRRNPALGEPLEGLDLLPSEPKKPETFATKAEEIAFYEQKLARERVILEKRSQFLDRVKTIRAGAKTAEEKQVAESRGKIVEDNFEEQQKVVGDLEKKLAGLKGG
jgi:hypothetical protein